MRATLDHPDLVHPNAEIAAGGDVGILLTHRAGGGVARIGEHAEPGLRLAAIEILEGGVGHVDLAANFEDPGRVAEQPERDRLDGTQIGGDVLAGGAVSPGGAPG